MREIIEAREGYILTDGKTYGTTIYLAEGVDASAFREITLEEYNAMFEGEEATAEDYQNELRGMGVQI